MIAQLKAHYIALRVFSLCLSFATKCQPIVTTDCTGAQTDRHRHRDRQTEIGTDHSLPIPSNPSMSN